MIRGAFVACVLCACAQDVEPASAPAASQNGAAPSLSMRELRRALSRSPESLRFERRGGLLHIDLTGTFQTATVVVPDGSGQTRRVCLDDVAELDRMLEGAR